SPSSRSKPFTRSSCERIPASAASSSAFNKTRADGTPPTLTEQSEKCSPVQRMPSDREEDRRSRQSRFALGFRNGFRFVQLLLPFVRLVLLAGSFVQLNKPFQSEQEAIRGGAGGLGHFLIGVAKQRFGVV